MEKYKKILVVCAVLALLISACAGGEDTPAVAGAGGNGAAAAGEAAAPVDEITTMTVFINHTWYWTDRFEGIIPEALTERTGVRLDVTRAVDDAQMGLMIASGDLHDLVFTWTDLDRLSTSRLSHPYNELIERYVPEWTPCPIRVNIAKAMSDSDNFYFLRNNFNTPSEWENYPGLPMFPTLAYRADILERLGNPPMSTIDEYVDVLRMVRDEFPDMIPLATSLTRSWRLMPFRVWMGVGNSDFIERADGSIIHFMNHPDYEEYARFINYLFREGLIMADNFAMTEADTKTLITNSQAFSFTGYSQGEMYRFGLMARSVDPDASMRESRPLGTRGNYYFSGTGWSGTIITRDNPAPDKAIRMMYFLFSDEGQRLAQWGREGIEWTMGGDGFPIFSQEWLDASADDNIFYTKFNPAFFFGTSAAVEATGRIAVLPDYYRSVYEYFRPFMVFNPWIGHALPTGDIEERHILARLTDLWESFEVRVFLSSTEEEFERNFSEMINNAHQIGIEQLEAFMTEEVRLARPLFE